MHSEHGPSDVRQYNLNTMRFNQSFNFARCEFVCSRQRGFEFEYNEIQSVFPFRSIQAHMFSLVKVCCAVHVTSVQVLRA